MQDTTQLPKTPWHKNFAILWLIGAMIAAMSGSAITANLQYSLSWWQEILHIIPFALGMVIMVWGHVLFVIWTIKNKIFLKVVKFWLWSMFIYALFNSLLFGVKNLVIFLLAILLIWLIYQIKKVS